MKRRDFFEKGGCGLAAAFMAYLGGSACRKKETEIAAGVTDVEPVEYPAPVVGETLADRREVLHKILMEKMGKTHEEAEAMIADFEEKLPMVKDACICKTCPSYVAEEIESGFCHPLIGKSKIITEEKGCLCADCPIYVPMELKNGYYCTRGSELEIESAKA